MTKISFLTLLLAICLDGSAQWKRINGLSLEAPPKELKDSDFTPIQKLNANWVAIIPFAFSKKGDTKIQYDSPYQWWGEKKEGTIKSIQLAKKAGLKVMLKPQLWIHDQFVGDIDFGKSELKWKAFESSIKKYILDFAHIAADEGVEIYSIGCEYKIFATQRKEFWTDLITEIRSFYKGKLTYSSNWDNYNNISFWDQLDYVGIDCYFPLSESKTPTVNELKRAWSKRLTSLKQFSEQTNKQIIFCEYGFMSIDSTAHETWNPNQEGAVNLIAQKNAYTAMFERLEDQPWYAGGFFWKWKANHKEAGGKDDKRFTPQNKPAEEVIRKWFTKS